KALRNRSVAVDEVTYDSQGCVLHQVAVRCAEFSISLMVAVGTDVDWNARQLWRLTRRSFSADIHGGYGLIGIATQFMVEVNSLLQKCPGPAVQTDEL